MPALPSARGALAWLFGGVVDWLAGLGDWFRRDPWTWGVLTTTTAGGAFGTRERSIFGQVRDFDHPVFGVRQLEEDGSVREFAYTHGTVVKFEPADEADVRHQFVHHHRRRDVAPPCHAFEASPVCCELCSRCARNAGAHALEAERRAAASDSIRARQSTVMSIAELLRAFYPGHRRILETNWSPDGLLVVAVFIDGQPIESKAWQALAEAGLPMGTFCADMAEPVLVGVDDGAPVEDGRAS
jgi:hypothetical protein